MGIKALGHFLEHLPGELIHFANSPEAAAEFQKISGVLTSLLPYAVPAVQTVAAHSGNRTVQEIAALLEKVNLPASIHPDTPPNDPSIKGLLLQAATAALHGNLSAALVDAGEAGLTLGGVKITKMTQLHPGLLSTAVQLVYTFLKSGEAAPLLALI